MDLTVASAPASEQLGRSIYMTNDEWLVASQCVESFADSYRAKHSQTIATFVTRGQIDEAISEGQKMNQLLQKLDYIQAKLVS